MSTLVVKGAGSAISASTTANLVNKGSNVNTWYFFNNTANVASVKVQTTNADFALQDGILVAPGFAVIVSGDFNSAYQGNVFVGANLVAGSGTVYATPIIEA